MELLEQFGIDIGYVCIGLTGAVVVLVVLFLILWIRQNKMLKKYREFMKGDKDVVTMEKLIESRKMAIIKYNAFPGMGGNLSFVLALLDKSNNGFLLNAMHSKEGCYTYIKEVAEGSVKVELSDEEKEALQEAVSQK